MDSDRTKVLEQTSGVLSMMSLHGCPGPTVKDIIRYQTEQDMERIIGTPLYIALNGVVTTERTQAFSDFRYGTGTSWRQKLPERKPR